MDAVWMFVWMLAGAIVFAAGFYMGSAGTVRRLQRDVEDELEMLSHQRERIRGRSRRAAAAEEVPTARNGEQPMTRAERKERLRRRAAVLFPQLVRTTPNVLSNQQKQT